MAIIADTTTLNAKTRIIVVLMIVEERISVGGEAGKAKHCHFFKDALNYLDVSKPLTSSAIGLFFRA
jgi:hypothetical protein